VTFRKDITGFRHSRGRLTAVKFSYIDENGQAVWDCLCDCGGKKQAAVSCLLKGDTLSCGCLRRELCAARAHKWTAFGETKTAAQWVADDRCTVEVTVLRERLKYCRTTKDIERAITMPHRYLIVDPTLDLGARPKRSKKGVPLKELLGVAK